jgi:hypothetical protein
VQWIVPSNPAPRTAPPLVGPAAQPLRLMAGVALLLVNPLAGPFYDSPPPRENQPHHRPYRRAFWQS